MIYLDNAATTFPKKEEVYTAMDRTNRSLAFNAGRGSYAVAREAADLIDKTRTCLQNLFHAEGMADIVFTPSVTHALNQVLNGVPLGPNSVIYVTPYEHNAVARTTHALAHRFGFALELLPLADDLQIDIDKVAFEFTKRPPSLVVVNALSNVTGYVTPFKQLFLLAKQYGAITVLDAAQAAGLLDLNMPEIQADIICFAGHKSLGGPFGIAGFAIRRDLTLNKTFVGGTGSDSLNLEMPESAPGRYEAASPNIVAIAGLLAALKDVDIKGHRAKLQMLTDYFLNCIEDIPKVRVLGTLSEQPPLGIVSFVMEGYQSDEVGEILDAEFDIAVRTGYHCAPYIHRFLNDTLYNGTIRVGFSPFNTESEIDALVDALDTL